MPTHKDFYDAVSNTSISADTINLNVDAVETKLDTATGLLTTLSADTALIKADVANGVSVSGTVTANTGLTQPLTDAQLRNTAVPISGSISVSNLPATQPISGSVSVSNFPATQPISGTVTANTGLVPLTDTQLRATAVPISGTVTANTGLAQPLTDTQLRAAVVPISGTVTANTGLTPLTDTQLRATAVPVSLASVPSHAVTGTFWQTTQPVSLATAPTTPVTGTFWQTTQPISGTVTANTGLTQPLTDTQLRATALPVSLSSLPALTAGTAQIGVVAITQSTASAVTSFTSLTSATLIASNASRKMLTIQNVGAGILYVLFGSGTASASNFSVQMNSGDFYENNYYSGQMNAIFATAGTAYVTSLT